MADYESDGSMPGLASASSSSDGSMPDEDPTGGAQGTGAKKEEGTPLAAPSDAKADQGTHEAARPLETRHPAVDDYKPDPNKVVNEKSTRVRLVAAASAGDLVEVSKCIADLIHAASKKKGEFFNPDAKVNAKLHRGDTPLVAACRRDQTEAARILLEKGASPEARSHDGSTPLAVAAAGGFVKTIEVLVEFGAECDEASTVYPHHIGLYVSHDRGGRSGDNAGGDGGGRSRDRSKARTPLEHAVDQCEVDVVRRLLRAGATPSSGLAAKFSRKYLDGVINEVALEDRARRQQHQHQLGAPRVDLEAAVEAEVALASALLAERTALIRSLARPFPTDLETMEQRRRRGLLLHCDVLLQVSGVDAGTLAAHTNVNPADLDYNDDGGLTGVAAVHRAIEAAEACLDVCAVVDAEREEFNVRASPKDTSLVAAKVDEAFGAGHKATLGDALVLFRVKAVHRLTELLAWLARETRSQAIFDNSVDSLNRIAQDQGVYRGLLTFPSPNTAQKNAAQALATLLTEAQKALDNHPKARDAQTFVADDGNQEGGNTTHAASNKGGGGQVVAPGNPRRVLLRAGGDSVRTCDSRDEWAKTAAALAAPIAVDIFVQTGANTGVKAASSSQHQQHKSEKKSDKTASSSSSSAKNANPPKKLTAAEVKAVELAKAKAAAEHAKKDQEQLLEAAKKRKQELVAAEATKQAEAARKAEREAAKKKRKEEEKIRQETAMREKKLKEAWTEADKALRRLEARPFAEIKCGRDWLRIQRELGVGGDEASDMDNDDGDDNDVDDDANPDVGGGDNNNNNDDDDAKGASAPAATHEEVLLTEAVVNWLKRRSAGDIDAAKKADFDAVTAAVDGIAAGDATSVVARTLNDKFRVRVRRVPGTRWSVLWSAHASGAATDTSGRRLDQALVWLVVRRLAETRSLELIEDALQRREDHVTTIQDDEDDAVFLAPGRNRPTLLYVLAARTAAGKNQRHVDADPVARQLRAANFHPKLRLTRREKDAVEHEGAPAMVLGRSGTGKTLIIVERIRRDRELAPDKTRVLFAARSAHLADRVASRVCASDDAANLARSDRPADDVRTEYFLTTEQLFTILDRKAVTAPEGGGAATDYSEVEIAVDFRRFEDLFWNADVGRQVLSRSRKVAAQLTATTVWVQIQSFIKGSTKAALDGRPLTRDEYTKQGLIGDRRAGHVTDDERKLIYDFFEAYQNLLLDRNLWDAADRELELVQRILNFGWKEDEATGVGAPPADMCYCDEVQDMTQLTLVLLLLCCGNRPDNLFACGDTAQAIQDGVAFRFSDVRQAVYELYEAIEKRGFGAKMNTTAAKDGVLHAAAVSRRAVTLTRNYRTHAGILRLANQSLDLLKSAFATALDVIDHDEGYAAGPRPLYAVTPDAQAVVLSAAWQDADILFRSAPLQEARKGAREAEQSYQDKLEEAKVRLAGASADEDLYETLEQERDAIYADEALRAELRAREGAWARRERDRRTRRWQADSWAAVDAAAAAATGACDAATVQAAARCAEVGRRIAILRAACDAHAADADRFEADRRDVERRRDEDRARRQTTGALQERAALLAAQATWERNNIIDLLRMIPGLMQAEQIRYSDMLIAEEVDVETLPHLTDDEDWADLGFAQVDMEIAHELRALAVRLRDQAQEASELPPLPPGADDGADDAPAIPDPAPLASLADFVRRFEARTPPVDRASIESRSKTRPFKPSAAAAKRADDDHDADPRADLTEAALDARVDQALEQRVIEMCKSHGGTMEKLRKYTRAKKKASKLAGVKSGGAASIKSGAARIEAQAHAEVDAAYKETVAPPSFEAYRCISDKRVSSRAFTIAEYKGLEKEAIAIVDFFGSASADVIPGWKALFAAANAADTSTRLAKFDEAGKCKALERDIKLLYTALTRSRSRLIIVEQDLNAGVAKAAVNFFKQVNSNRGNKQQGDVLAEKYTRSAADDDANGSKRDLVPDEWRARGAQMARVATSSDGSVAERRILLQEAQDAFTSANDDNLAKRCEAQSKALDWRREIRDSRANAADPVAALQHAKLAATYVKECIANLALPEAVVLARAANNEALAAKVEALYRHDFTNGPAAP